MDPINGKIEDWYGAMKVMFDIAAFFYFYFYYQQPPQFVQHKVF